MIQSGEILRELLVVLPYAAVKARTQQLIKKKTEKNQHQNYVNMRQNRLLIKD